MEIMKWVDFLVWCENYQRNSDQRDPVIRFAIGFYQLKQMINWEHSAARPQSAAAFMIHTIAAVGIVREPVKRKFDADKMLVNTAGLFQQLLYMRNTKPGMLRNSRINPNKLEEYAWNCLCMVKCPGIMEAAEVEMEGLSKNVHHSRK